MKRPLLLPIAVLAALSGCAPQADPALPPAYTLSPADALARLRQADLAAFAAAERCSDAVDVAAADSGDGGLKWSVTRGLFNIAGFSVRLDPVDAGVRPVIVVPADPAGGEIYDGSGHTENPALRQPVRPALAELVDSALTGRRFDAAKVRAAQPADGLCHGGSVSVSGAGKAMDVSNFTNGAAPAPAGAAAARPAGPGVPVGGNQVSQSNVGPPRASDAPDPAAPPYVPQDASPHNPADDGREGQH